MNIYDVAEKAGVSIATVSRVLNGSDKVKPATKQKIEQIIAESGFVKSDPHSRRKSSMCVGYIFVNFKFHASALLAEDITRALGFRGYHMFTACTDGDFNNLHIAIHHLKDLVDCFIIQTGDFSELPQSERSFLIRIAKDLPIILLEGNIDAPNIYNLRYDLNTQISNFITSNYHKGKKNILFLFSSMNSHAMGLLDAYRTSYEMLHDEPSSMYMHLCPDINSTMQYVHEIIEKDALPDMVLTTNQELAYATSIIFNQNEKTAAIPIFSAEYYNATVCESLVNTTLQILEKKKTPSTVVIPGVITQIETS